MDDELQVLREEAAQLRARLEALEQHLARAQPTSPVEGEVGAGRSRRDLLRVAAGAAAGAVAVSLADATPAAAITGETMRAGYMHNSMNTTGFHASDFAGNYTSGQGSPISPSNPVVYVWGYRSDNSRLDGLHVNVRNESVAVLANGHWGIAATSDSGGTGVQATAPDGIGLAVSGGQTAIYFFPTDKASLHTETGSPGGLDMDGNGDLWFCGADGKWRKLAGQTTAGAFHPISPTRVYDSRGGSPFQPNESRWVYCNKSSGGADVVPLGATAITYNLTVAAPTGPNYLAIAHGFTDTYSASAINFPGGFDCANGGVVPIDAFGRVRIFCGNQTGSTHVLLDVTGYYL